MALRTERASEETDARRDRIALRQPGEVTRRLLGEGGEGEDGIPNWLNVQARMGNLEAVQLRERLLTSRGDARREDAKLEEGRRQFGMTHGLMEGRDRREEELHAMQTGPESEIARIDMALQGQLDPVSRQDLERRRAQLTSGLVGQLTGQRGTQGTAPSMAPQPGNQVGVNTQGTTPDDPVHRQQLVTQGLAEIGVNADPYDVNRLLQAGSSSQRHSIYRQLGVPQEHWGRFDNALRTWAARYRTPEEHTAMEETLPKPFYTPPGPGERTPTFNWGR